MRLIAHQSVAKVIGSQQNEDVFFPMRKSQKPFSRFVMCDGATTSFAGHAWAKALAKALYSAPKSVEVFANELFRDDEHFQNSIRDEFFSNCFKQAIAEYEKQYDVSKLSFFKQEAFKRGSAATLLFLVQDDKTPDTIYLTAIGDTCCFIMDSANNVIRSFPLTSVEEFSTSAYLVDTKKEGLKALFNPTTREFFWKRATVDISSGDGVKIVCATDAISQWIIANSCNANAISELLLSVEKPRRQYFESFIQSLRHNGAIAVDDSTIAVLGK